MGGTSPTSFQLIRKYWDSGSTWHTVTFNGAEVGKLYAIMLTEYSSSKPVIAGIGNPTELIDPQSVSTSLHTPLLYVGYVTSSTITIQNACYHTGIFEVVFI